MLPRALQAAALAERILSGSLNQFLNQAACCGGAQAWQLSQRLPQRQTLSAQQMSRAAYSSAIAAAVSEEVSGLIIHPSAASRLRELQAEKPGSSLALRIEVEGGGCSGFQYKFKLDDEVKPEDVLFEAGGGRVVCDTVSLEFLRGATLEFEDTLMRAAFTISKNPNAEASCGCGSSFAAKLK